MQLCTRQKVRPYQFYFFSSTVCLLSPNLNFSFLFFSFLSSTCVIASASDFQDYLILHTVFDRDLFTRLSHSVSTPVLNIKDLQPRYFASGATAHFHCNQYLFIVRGGERYGERCLRSTGPISIKWPNPVFDNANITNI